MTDLSARLRDVLSDETLDKICAWDTATYDDARDGVIEVLLPCLSSLFEEREREIREALEELRRAGPVTPEMNRALSAFISRLASSSSPAAPQK